MSSLSSSITSASAISARPPGAERLGFTLTPRSIHRGSPPGAVVVPSGPQSFAMFHEGYLEVVGLVDPQSSATSADGRCEGAYIVAFGVESADALPESPLAAYRSTRRANSSATQQAAEQ
jgi:hypothetical protein